MKKIHSLIGKRLWSYCFLSMLVAGLSLQAEYKVLFVGNSYTIGQGPGPETPGGYEPSSTGRTIPDIFDALARAGGQEDPTTDAWMDGGKGFKDHYENGVLDDFDADPDWTHVVLQNYSTGPTHVGNIEEHMTYGGLLYDEVIAKNPGAQVHLYMTWARAEVNDMISGTSTATTFASTDEMLDELRTNYYALANSLTADHPENLPVIVNPVGDAWNNAGGNLPASDPDFIDLFYSDEYHGNNLGYYLSACVHYASIYKSSPVGLFQTSIIQDLLQYSIDAEDAAFVEQIAWETVLETDIIESSILIDFGATDSQALSQASQAKYWNNLTESVGSTLNASILNLLDKTGGASSVDLTILAPFNSVESTGTVDATVYSEEVTMDALFGNTELYNGQSNVAPSFKLSELDPNTAYRLSFYASRSGGSDNYQARYQATGDRVVSVDLDPQDNVDTLAETDALYPDVNNEITVSMAAGPENDNAAHLIYLGAVKLSEISEASLSLSSQPVAQSIEENGSVTFSVTVDSDRLVTAQWYQDGSPISGATSLSYTIAQASRAVDGSEFSVIVDNGVFSLESSSATLTVISDLTEPLVETVSRAGSQILELTFDEALDSEAALILDNYKIANRGQLLSPSSVAISTDGKTITLSFEEPWYGNAVVQLSEQLTDLVGNSIPLIDRTQSYVSSETIYIDFGETNSVTDSVDTWNEVSMNSNIANPVGDGTGEPYIYTDDLLKADGTSSEIGLSMSDALSASSATGTSSGPYPSGATNDSCYGSDSDIQGVFHFYNLDTDISYSFTFYASRINVSENREARYTLDGIDTSMADLNPTGNLTNTVTISGVQPNSEGVITLTVSAGDDNDQSSHYFYIGAVEISLGASADEQVFVPVPLGDFMVIDWTGSGTLMWTDDLTADWQAVDSEATAPYQDEAVTAGERFYRLEY
jgi:hypothetical protein